MFASVGGLALLAEHLPLLYPDITRQGTAADVSTSDNNNIADLGQDWVTVESSDELYDVSCEGCVLNGVRTLAHCLLDRLCLAMHVLSVFWGLPQVFSFLLLNSQYLESFVVCMCDVYMGKSTVGTM